MEAKLKTLYDVSSEAELMRTVKNCTPFITRLTQLAAQRFSVSHATPDSDREPRGVVVGQEEKSEERQQILAAAQTQLNQASRCLITSSKVTQKQSMSAVINTRILSLSYP